MAQALVTATRRHLPNDIDHAALAEARIDLAACFRMAARLGMNEGVCNHFSAMLPGRDDLFLVNPLGLAFEEITASSLLVCDLSGAVIDGDGEPEATAFYIHARVHLRRPGAKAVFHTHMPYATSLAMVDGEPLVFAGQSALRFWGRVAVDPVYGGLALDEAEGDRIASAMGGADVIFLRNHGVIVAAPTIAEAWDDLYYLERAAEAQVLAMSTGRSLVPVEPGLAESTARQMQAERSGSAAMHLASVKRRLALNEPEFAM